jgi:hypothetical protein
MAYFNVGNIKGILNLDSLAHEEDEQITRYGRDADDFINTQLGVFTSTPLSTPDDQTRRFSERLAAAWYVFWNSPSHPMQGVYDTKKEISEYIVSQYKKEAAGLSKDTYVKTNSGITGRG